MGSRQRGSARFACAGIVGALALAATGVLMVPTPVAASSVAASSVAAQPPVADSPVVAVDGGTALLVQPVAPTVAADASTDADRAAALVPLVAIGGAVLMIVVLRRVRRRRRRAVPPTRAGESVDSGERGSVRRSARHAARPSVRPSAPGYVGGRAVGRGGRGGRDPDAAARISRARGAVSRSAIPRDHGDVPRPDRAGSDDPPDRGT